MAWVGGNACSEGSVAQPDKTRLTTQAMDFRRLRRGNRTVAPPRAWSLPLPAIGKNTAGSGNRTRVASLGSWCTTTVLYPRRSHIDIQWLAPEEGKPRVSPRAPLPPPRPPRAPPPPP